MLGSALTGHHSEPPGGHERWLPRALATASGSSGATFIQARRTLVRRRALLRLRCFARESQGRRRDEDALLRRGLLPEGAGPTFRGPLGRGRTWRSRGARASVRRAPSRPGRERSGVRRRAA